MPHSAAIATSVGEYLSRWRGPLEEHLHKAVGKALAEQPEDPCTAVALELLRGTGLEERAAALSAAQVEQEDGPQDDLAGRPFQRRCLRHSPLASATASATAQSHALFSFMGLIRSFLFIVRVSSVPRPR